MFNCSKFFGLKKLAKSLLSPQRETFRYYQQLRQVTVLSRHHISPGICTGGR